MIQRVELLRHQLSDKESVVGNTPGCYILWMKRSDAIKLVHNIKGVEVSKIKEKRIDGEIYLAMYFGISKDLFQRAQWHFCQSHKESFVKNGTLSTLRQTLSALLEIPMTSSETQVNKLLDSACYWEWCYMDEQCARSEEKRALEEEYYPLNIQDNKSVPKEAIRTLKHLRKLYKL